MAKPDERLKALLAAGADLVLEPGVGPEMDLTPQEAYAGATEPGAGAFNRAPTASARLWLAA